MQMHGTMGSTESTEERRGLSPDGVRKAEAPGSKARCSRLQQVDIAKGDTSNCVAHNDRDRSGLQVQSSPRIIFRSRLIPVNVILHTFLVFLISSFSSCLENLWRGRSILVVRHASATSPRYSGMQYTCSRYASAFCFFKLSLEP